MLTTRDRRLLSVLDVGTSAVFFALRLVIHPELETGGPQALGVLLVYFFFFNDTATTEIYTLSLHDALPISRVGFLPVGAGNAGPAGYRHGAISLAQRYQVHGLCRIRQGGE